MDFFSPTIGDKISVALSGCSLLFLPCIELKAKTQPKQPKRYASKSI